MAWVHLVTLLALVEYLAFIVLVGKARNDYGVKAPATSGHEVFERYFRVQMNTLELLIIFVPALWMAAAYWNPMLVAAIGAVYVAGRLLYLREYVAEPGSRTLGYVLSSAPVIVLLAGAGIGLLRALAGI